ncbi:hypothetical protein F4861DRAFT_536408 [Xylaria intraflava]|nr:hypothetical protein F4861DRAFT_536408 [Xylaria intraflava]
MATQQDRSRTSPKRASTCPFEPEKNNPAAAEQFVRNLFKQRPHNLSVAATELAPLFGFGPDSTHNVIARLRTQAVFASREIGIPYGEFTMRYTRRQWDLPTAKWEPTMALVRKHGDDEAWAGDDEAWAGDECPVPTGSGPEAYYARFLLVVMSRLRLGAGVPWMMMWLRDALADGRDDDVCWVLFHTLMYLQLEGMRFNRDRAPFREVAEHYVHKAGPRSLLAAFSRGRKGLVR